MVVVLGDRLAWPVLVDRVDLELLVVPPEWHDDLPSIWIRASTAFVFRHSAQVAARQAARTIGVGRIQRRPYTRQHPMYPRRPPRRPLQQVVASS